MDEDNQLPHKAPQNGERYLKPSFIDLDIDRALTRPDPINTETRSGHAPDEIDDLKLYHDGDHDTPPAIDQILTDAETDPGVAEMVRLFHLKETGEKQLEAFYRNGSPQAISELMDKFGVDRSSSIADLGCGCGWLSYSLDKMGYQSLLAMDPNKGATETLKEVAGERIEVINELDDWRSIRHRFDAVVSFATIHHWDHIPWIALETRRTMKPGGYWFAAMEWFASTPIEFLNAMRTHPTRERYRCYEWAYPASAYVDLIQSVGLSLVAVVPYFYQENLLVTARFPTPEGLDQQWLDDLVDQNLTGPNSTVDLFWQEVDELRRNPSGWKLFSVPQVMVFQRTAV